MGQGDSIVVERRNLSRLSPQDILASIAISTVSFSIIATNAYFEMLSIDALKTLALTDYAAFSISYLIPFFWFTLFISFVLFINLNFFSPFIHLYGTIRNRILRSKINAAIARRALTGSLTASLTGKAQETPQGKQGLRVRRGVNYNKGGFRRGLAIFLLAVAMSGVILIGVGDEIYLATTPSYVLIITFFYGLILFYIHSAIQLFVGWSIHKDSFVISNTSELEVLGYKENDIKKIYDEQNLKNEQSARKVRNFFLLIAIGFFSFVGASYGQLIAIYDYRMLYDRYMNRDRYLFAFEPDEDAQNAEDVGISDGSSHAAPTALGRTLEPKTLDEIPTQGRRNDDHAPAIDAARVVDATEDGRISRFTGGDVVRVVEHGILAVDAERKHLLFVNDNGFIKAEFPLQYAGYAEIGRLKACLGERSLLVSFAYWLSRGAMFRKVEFPKCDTISEIFEKKHSRYAKRRAENSLEDRQKALEQNSSPQP